MQPCRVAALRSYQPGCAMNEANIAYSHAVGRVRGEGNNGVMGLAYFVAHLSQRVPLQSVPHCKSSPSGLLFFFL